MNLPRYLPIGRFETVIEPDGRRALRFRQTSPFYLNTETGFLEWEPGRKEGK